MVVGFQVTELRVEETIPEVVIEIVLLQGRAKREFIVGVQTEDDSATSQYKTIIVPYTISFN